MNKKCKTNKKKIYGTKKNSKQKMCNYEMMRKRGWMRYDAEQR